MGNPQATSTKSTQEAADLMREVVIIPTLRRQELLYCCLKRIREFEPKIEVHIFPDRGTFHDPLVQAIGRDFGALVHLVPDHPWYGNTANTMNAYLWAYNAGYDRVFYIESDVIVHKDFFSWHRKQQEDFPFIFASLGWIFNRQAPIVDDLLFQPWIYAIGVCISREKLALVVEHATPNYFSDMPGYIERRFKTNPLNVPFAIAHWEHDGALQRILDEDKSQTVTPGIAKCSHVGFTRSYGGDTQEDYERFLGLEGLPFMDRVARVEEFIADPYWRAQVFGRAIVEREVGMALPKREFKYRVKLPGGWESTFVTELSRAFLPKRINSVPIPADAEIVLTS